MKETTVKPTHRTPKTENPGAGGRGAMRRAHASISMTKAEMAARIEDLEAALRKINALIDSPARFNAEVQAVLDSVIDTSDTKFNTK